MDFKILIVDDYVDLHRILALAVKSVIARRINGNQDKKESNTPLPPQIKADFSSAYHGEEALSMALEAKAKKCPYDLVFMDILMPGSDGLATAKKLLHFCPTTEVVFVTAHSSYTWQDIVGAVGCEEQISIIFKPFDIEKLSNHVITVITKVLARKVKELPSMNEPGNERFC